MPDSATGNARPERQLAALCELDADSVVAYSTQRIYNEIK